MYDKGQQHGNHDDGGESADSIGKKTGKVSGVADTSGLDSIECGQEYHTPDEYGGQTVNERAVPKFACYTEQGAVRMQGNEQQYGNQ
jgi:hypothetical protein